MDLAVGISVLVGVLFLLLLTYLTSKGKLSKFSAKIKDWFEVAVEGPEFKPTPVITDETSPGSEGIITQVTRFKRVMSAHGMRPEHWQRFFEKCRAPFSINLSDLKDDNTILEWLNDQKIEWLCRALLIRRDWMDGEDHADPHKFFCFNKNPKEFLTTLEKEISSEFVDLECGMPEAIFALNKDKKNSENDQDARLIFAVGLPLCKFSNELTVYRWIRDDAAGGYPWHSEPYRTHIRIVARLAFRHFNMSIWGLNFEAKEFDNIDNGDLLVPEVLKKPGRHHNCWHPEDYSLSPLESRVAKETETLPKVLDSMKRMGLPKSKVKHSRRLERGQ